MATATTKSRPARTAAKGKAPKPTPPASKTAPSAQSPAVPEFSDIDSKAGINPETPVKEVPQAEKKTPREVKQEQSVMRIVPDVISGKRATAALTPDKLKELAFISTYNTKDSQSTSPQKNGYQREPMKSRFPGIGKYYASGDNSHYITPIIASARVYSEEGRREFMEMFNAGDIAGIHKKFTKSAFSIIDGQHRLNGLYWAWENKDEFNTEVPVMVFFGLRYPEEATLFDDINTNQRKLPKALIEATKVHMYSGDMSHAQKIRVIARSLAQDGDSVWHGMINMTGAHDRERPISFEGLRRATNDMFQTTLIARLEDKGYRPAEVAKQYWQIVSEACSPAWERHPKIVEDAETGELKEIPVKYRLNDLAGVASVARLGGRIVETALDRSRDDDEFWEVIAEMVSKLSAVDWEKRPGNVWTSYGAGFAGVTGLYQTLYNLVYRDKMPGIDSEDESDEQ